MHMNIQQISFMIHPFCYSWAEDGLLLTNGDRLQPVQRPSRRAEEFDLPKSVCDYALLVYSDFNCRDAEGRPRKTILVRVIEMSIG
jgi:hypothetical protein